jgi:hypothetical protein
MIITYEKPVDSMQDILDMHKTLYIPSGTTIQIELAISKRSDFHQAYEMASKVSIL